MGGREGNVVLLRHTFGAAFDEVQGASYASVCELHELAQAELAGFAVSSMARMVGIAGGNEPQGSKDAYSLSTSADWPLFQCFL